MNQPEWPQPSDAQPATSPGGPAGNGRRPAVIATIVLSVLVVLCLGGGFGAYAVTSRLDGNGDSSPARAVTGFLRAVYVQKDADAAATHVCRTSRDPRAIARKIRQVRSAEKKYDSPRYTWTQPRVGSQQVSRATVTAEVTLTTADEKTAVQRLKFLVIKQRGWFVCEVTRLS